MLNLHLWLSVDRRQRHQEGLLRSRCAHSADLRRTSQRKRRLKLRLRRYHFPRNYPLRGLPPHLHYSCRYHHLHVGVGHPAGMPPAQETKGWKIESLLLRVSAAQGSRHTSGELFGFDQFLEPLFVPKFSFCSATFMIWYDNLFNLLSNNTFIMRWNTLIIMRKIKSKHGSSLKSNNYILINEQKS